MSFSNVLSSVFGKRPIWLYRLTKDGNERFYTSRNSNYEETTHDFFDTQNVFGSEITDFFSRVWVSSPLFQTRIRNTSAIGRAETDLTFPQTNTWAQEYVDENSYSDNTVVIYQLFTNDPDLEKQLRFRGRVIATQAMLTRITLTCENRFTEMRQKALAQVIQRPCRHSLYHSVGCTLNIADFQTDGTITNIDELDLTVSEASAQADAYYSGGIVEWEGKYQQITKHSGSTLTLLAPIPGLVAAQAGGNQSVKIAPGCTLSRATCNDRFNNLANFGGFPWADETPYDGKTLF